MKNDVLMRQCVNVLIKNQHINTLAYQHIILVTRNCPQDEVTCNYFKNNYD
jgi:hypothetical protein